MIEIVVTEVEIDLIVTEGVVTVTGSVETERTGILATAAELIIAVEQIIVMTETVEDTSLLQW